MAAYCSTEAEVRLAWSTYQRHPGVSCFLPLALMRSDSRMLKRLSWQRIASIQLEAPKVQRLVTSLSNYLGTWMRSELFFYAMVQCSSRAKLRPIFRR